MEFSLFLAHSWGIFLFLVCFGLLLNRKTFIDTLKKIDHSSLLLIGLILVGIGSVQVIGYESWTFDWKGFVTLLGWLTLLKGVAILYIPDFTNKLIKFAIRDNIYSFTLIFGIILGIYLFTIQPTIF